MRTVYVSSSGCTLQWPPDVWSIVGVLKYHPADQQIQVASSCLGPRLESRFRTYAFGNCHFPENAAMYFYREQKWSHITERH